MAAGWPLHPTHLEGWKSICALFRKGETKCGCQPKLGWFHFRHHHRLAPQWSRTTFCRVDEQNFSPFYLIRLGERQDCCTEYPAIPFAQSAGATNSLTQSPL